VTAKGVRPRLVMRACTGWFNALSPMTTGSVRRAAGVKR